MRCLYCRNTIGPIRRLFDRQYCSRAHRRQVRPSARAVREAIDLYGDDETWVLRPDPEKSSTRAVTRYGTAAAVLTCLILLMSLWLGPSVDVPVSKIDYTLSSSRSFSQTLRGLLPGRPSVNLREEFRGSLANWVGASLGSNDWVVSSGVTRPGGLRFWKQTMKLSDYEFEFQGQIERKGLGWTYRSLDFDNYYAGKIVLPTSGGADIVRYVVLNGQARDRVELPIPVPIHKDVFQRITVTVKGARFTTAINGQLVDSWTDNRLRLGGVGFFADKGELARIRTASLLERRGLMDRLFAGFLFGPSILW